MKKNAPTVIGESHSTAILSGEVVAGDILSDEDAIAIFLQSYSRKSKHTVRSYEKECYRFLLWVRALSAENNPSLLPSVTVQDANNYLEFLTSPRPFNMAFLKANGWDHQPFRKGLGEESIKHSITVLNSLFLALREMRTTGNAPYCLFNPMAIAHKGIAGSEATDLEVEEALTDEEWEAVQLAVEDLPRKTERDLKHYHRARWIMQLLYRTFLRRDEAASLMMNSFKSGPDGWTVNFVGKGNKAASIMVTTSLLEELKLYRASLGLTPLPSPRETRPAILAVTGKDKKVSAQAIYLLCKVIFVAAANKIESENPEAAERLRIASPHWMRHTGISHGLESGIDIRYIQAQARHSSLKMTAKYDHKKRRAWRCDLEKM